MVSGAIYAAVTVVNVRRRAKVRQIKVRTAFDVKARVARAGLIYYTFGDTSPLNVGVVGTP